MITADNITNVQKISQNNLETVKSDAVPKKDIYLLKKIKWNKMEYQKIINLLDNTSNQLSKFKAKNWVYINDDRIG